MVGRWLITGALTVMTPIAAVILNVSSKNHEDKVEVFFFMIIAAISMIGLIVATGGK